MAVDITPVQNSAEFEQALAIRVQVFVLEQGVPPEEEKDSYDESAFHLLARERGVPLATARLVQLPDKVGKVGRVAVLPEARGRGLGRDLMLRILQEARARSLRELTLGSQMQAVSFYERLGYVAQGGEFLDGGIPHVRMVLCLT